jgi:hypothetical protein
MRRLWRRISEVIVEHDEPEQHGGREHRAGAHQIALRARLDDRIPHVVRDRLVLGFLERVPEPHLLVAIDRAFDARTGLGEQQIREHGRVVFERDRLRELQRRRQHLAPEVKDRPQPLVELVRGQSRRLQQVVVLDVLARVHGFLADETHHLLLEVGVVDLVAIVAHGVHEKALARGKKQRQRVEEVVTGTPSTCQSQARSGGSAKRISRRTGMIMLFLPDYCLRCCFLHRR